VLKNSKLSIPMIRASQFALISFIRPIAVLNG